VFITQPMTNEKHRVVVDEFADAIEKLRVRIRVALIIIGGANQAARPIIGAMNLQ